MKFFLFHLMPYDRLPDDFDTRYDSAWVTLPNSHFDPERGHGLYTRYLDELVYGEELGFDGVCVNEHHQNAYGLMPSPNLIAAMLVQRTKRVRIAILGNALPLRDHPIRVAEEVAMLDVISGGRIISGFVRGIGCEYYSFGVNPTYSRERHLEAHDLIIRAWTEPGPFSFQGKHYQARYVNVWPRPLQQPHPPVWIPSQGSIETIEWAAERKYPFVRVYTPAARVKEFFDEYRAAAESFGYTASPEQLGWSMPVYVADTDAQAEKEAYPHLEYFFRRLLKIPTNMLVPPGYTGERSLQRMAKTAAGMNFATVRMEDMNEAGVLLVGGVETVRQRLLEYQRTMGFGIYAPMLQFATLPADLTRRGMELFAREIMPHLRDAADAAAGSKSATAVAT